MSNDSAQPRIYTMSSARYPKDMIASIRVGENVTKKLHSKKKSYVWLEEYKCSCSFVGDTRRELPGYCSVHGNDKIRVIRLPKDENFTDEDYGYVRGG